MQHWIISIVRVFKQAVGALFFGDDGTAPEYLLHRLGHWTGMGSDHGDGGWSIDTPSWWRGLDSPSAPTGPAFNIDGTPMTPGGLFDMAGKPFGVTDSGTGLGGSFGHDGSSGLSGTDWSSSSGSSMDWSSGSSWSSHDW